MSLVCFALIPGILAEVIFIGWGVLINILLCSFYAVSAEAFILKLRKKPVKRTLSDNSALLTGLLIAIALPPLIPWWMSFIGVFFAIIIAKQLYGGLGFNPFNPAMVGYVLLLISFPIEMTAWLPAGEFVNQSPSLLDSIQITLFGSTSSGLELESFRSMADGFTMATPLDHSKTAFSLGRMTSEFDTSPLFEASTQPWFWINFNFLIRKYHR